MIGPPITLARHSLWEQRERRRVRVLGIVEFYEDRAGIRLSDDERTELGRTIRLEDDGQTLSESAEVELMLRRLWRGELSARLTTWWKAVLDQGRRVEVAS